jgi:hypothetical protein
MIVTPSEQARELVDMSVVPMMVTDKNIFPSAHNVRSTQSCRVSMGGAWTSIKIQHSGGANVALRGRSPQLNPKFWSKPLLAHALRRR